MRKLETATTYGAPEEGRDVFPLNGRHLLATDVDGTLLTRDYRLLPEVRSAVQYVRSNGVLVMLATARGPAALEVVLSDLGQVDFAICFGGALVLERVGDRWGRTCSEGVSLTLNEVALVRDHARRLDIGLGAYTEQGAHLDTPNDWFERELAHTGEPTFTGAFSKITQPVFKMLAISDPSRAEDLELLRVGLPPTLEGVYSHPNYLEIMRSGISKGDALAGFCQQRGIDLASVATAGDSDNDVSMFVAAGHSAAMADSSIAARSAAKWHVLEPTGGLASAIAHFTSSVWHIAPPPSPNQSERS